MIIDKFAGFEPTYAPTAHFDDMTDGPCRYDRILCFRCRQQSDLLLEAPISAPDGYTNPAIVVGATAYRGLLNPI